MSWNAIGAIGGLISGLAAVVALFPTNIGLNQTSNEQAELRLKLADLESTVSVLQKQVHEHSPVAPPPEPPKTNPQSNIDDANVTILSSVNLRARCPKWTEGDEAVQEIPLLTELKAGDTAKLIKKVKTFFGHPWWEIEAFDEKRGIVVSGCATAKSNGKPTMEHKRA